MNLPLSIDDKKTAVRLFKDGAYGNTIRQFDRFTDAIDSDCSLFAVRQKGKAGGGFCRYNVKAEELALATHLATVAGIPLEEIYYNEMLNDDYVILQGEYVVKPDGDRWLHYSHLPLPMRDALKKESYHAKGLHAFRLVQSHMNHNSFDDFRDCLALWPGHAIEFTVCSKYVGQSPRRNTIIWEVRNY